LIRLGGIMLLEARSNKWIFIEDSNWREEILTVPELSKLS